MHMSYKLSYMYYTFKMEVIFLIPKYYINNQQYKCSQLMWLLSSTWSNSVFVLPKIDHGGIMTAGTKDKKSPKI